MMDWKKIIKTALETTAPRRDTPKLRDLSLARMPDIPGWKVDKPTPSEEMLGGGETEVTYSGRTENGYDLDVIADKTRGQWIARARGMELEAPMQGDVLDAGHVQDVLNFAMKQMDEEIAEGRKRRSSASFFRRTGAWDTIEDVARQHRTRTYFDDGEGLIGVYDHKGRVKWYRRTPAGYSLVGETATPEGAREHRLEEHLTESG